MPEISRFLGIIIYMHFNAHNPPHFHAEYNEFKASISIETLVRYRENLRQNDQEIFNLSFFAAREIFCFEDITNAQDLSLRSR
uniref:DUF4160 domain-containing protein n=1 Tax=Candidatus Kentrum sp. UNK TaxID=2126344 RepID=A0A451ABM2_9GAMM|nr:MAG: protein of unknown function (DUF4160) [Candidatus Kentron sp. UNK]VFK71652.1 MAG: protein of unknown function (DUF4160) [Candidatus Kentron sp. UNK]